MNSIVKQAQGHVEEFKKKELSINPPYAKSQEDILGLIDLYTANRFRDSSVDALFFNIVNTPRVIATKKVDLDTKDMRVKSENGDHLTAWFFQKELNLHMKEVRFGTFLNKIVTAWPKYGHIVLKRFGKDLAICDINNIIVDPTVPTLKDTLIVERHLWTKAQLFKFGKMKNWDNLEDAAEKGEKIDNKIVIYEMFDPLAVGKNYHIVVPGGKMNGWMLFAGKKKDPYRELKWEDVPNRWLGRGTVEGLFPNQIAKNESEKYFRDALKWTSLRMFQTKDETIAGNLLSEKENGDVLRVVSEVTPIATEERNLSAFQYADAKWDANTRDVSFTNDVVRGERPPAGTPLGTTQLQAVESSAFFDQKREELGLFIKDILLEDVIPEFKNRRRAKHLFMLAPSERGVAKIQRLIANQKANDSILKKIVKDGKLPDPGEVELLKGIAQDEATRELPVEIPSSFYDNLKYKIDMVITNEQLDVAAKLTTLQVAMQIVGSNPTILKDPVTRKIFMSMLEAAGVNPEDLDLEDSVSLQSAVQGQAAEQGGSIAAPTPIAPTASPASQQV